MTNDSYAAILGLSSVVEHLAERVKELEKRVQRLESKCTGNCKHLTGAILCEYGYPCVWLCSDTNTEWSDTPCYEGDI